MQMGFFDRENRLEKLDRLGDSLVRLNNVIQWEASGIKVGKTLSIK